MRLYQLGDLGSLNALQFNEADIPRWLGVTVDEVLVARYAVAP